MYSTRYLSNRKSTFLLYCISFFFFQTSFAQSKIDIPVVSPFSTITQRVGITDISIEYSRPQVKGREIWGQLVPFGYNSPNASKRDSSSPWRAGAEETTTITFDDDVTIQNQFIKKGKYSLFISVSKDLSAEIILNNASNQFGSFFYNSDYDVAKIKVKTEKAPFTEYLEYGFTDIEVNSALIYLQWENLRIPFKVEIDTHKLTIQKLLSQEAKNSESLDWRWRERATQYCITYKVSLKEGLRWATEALDTEKFKGARNYNTLTNYASLLLLNGIKDKGSKAVLDVLPMAGVGFSEFYGDQLLELGFPKESLLIWEYLMKNAPQKKAWIYENGYARAYSELGEYAKAISHLNKAKSYLPKGYDPKKIDDLIKNLNQKRRS